MTLQQFLKVKETLTHESYWDALRQTWDETKIPSLLKAHFRLLFRNNVDERPYKQLFMSKREQLVLNRLPDVVTVYRGYVMGINQISLAFTLDENIAKEYAKLYSSDDIEGKVLKMKVPKSKIFAYLEKDQTIIVI